MYYFHRGMRERKGGPCMSTSMKGGGGKQLPVWRTTDLVALRHPQTPPGIGARSGSAFNRATPAIFGVLNTLESLLNSTLR